jgi:hypothetical protein
LPPEIELTSVEPHQRDSVLDSLPADVRQILEKDYRFRIVPAREINPRYAFIKDSDQD